MDEIKNIKNALLTSIWDGGYEITSNCKVNLETKEIYDIDLINMEGLSIFEGEYVTIEGTEYSVSQGNTDNSDFFYN